MSNTVVLGVQLNHRNNTAPKFQEIITKYGCNIKTRIGLHKVEGNLCSTSGVILLELIGEEETFSALEAEIKTIPDAQVQKMIFND